MKRLIAAVLFSVLAVPAFAADNVTSGSSANGVWANDYNFIAPAQ